MKILLVNHYAGSLQHGMEYRPFYLAREWVRNGHQVTILAASFSHVRTRNPDLNSQHILEENIDGIRYVWLKTPTYPGNGMKRGINILSFVSSFFLRLKEIVRGEAPDVIITSSTHPLDIFPAYNLARKIKSKLIYEVHDLWPLSLIELGGMSVYHPFILLTQFAENFSYRKADHVVSLLPAAKEHMLSHGMDEEKFIHIPNGIDVAEWSEKSYALPEEHMMAITHLRAENHFIIGYAGAHGIANALDSILEAVKMYDAENIAFVLVGKGPEKENLVRQARVAGLENVIFLPPVAKEAVPALLNTMDALYIGLRSEPLFRFGVSPNKLIDYMMAGKPIIYAINAGNDMVTESNCGISISPETPQAVIAAAKKLRNMSETARLEMGVRGREYVLQKHDYRVLANKFLKLF